jgi:PAP2 superfamily
MRSLRHLGAVVAVVALAVPAVAQADAVDDWNVHATAAILASAPSAHESTLSWAMVQGAVYDAVNAIDGRYEGYLLTSRLATPFDSQDAAAATAAYRVLLNLAPSQKPVLDAHYAASLAMVPDGSQKTRGIVVGEAAAAAMLAARVDDGRFAPFTFVIGDQPGDWRPLTPTALDPAAWLGNVRPFLIESPSQFRSDGPNALTSRAYTKDFNEVKELGSLTSTTRTADQTTAAIFWQAQPMALWGGMLRSLSGELDTADKARLHGMVAFAAADAAISCWNDKYYWSFWRPLAAIREAGTDGNPATVADPNWRSLFDPATATVPPLGTPAFPDHPSGHGCLSGAVLNTAEDFFGTDKLEFDIFSSRFPGQPRHFERFSNALEEIVDARVWGGIHFRTADEQGALMGKQVARWVRQHYFERVR